MKFLIASGVAVVLFELAALWLVVSKLDVREDKTLDVSKAQADVKAVLADPTDGYGVSDIDDIECNNGQNPPIVPGGTFTCEVVIAGTKHVVTAVFQDYSGTYEVDRPR
ncbi:hypothetical protein GGC64_005807 [Mycobacterium sp. OAS707]|uniref:DUF4333 domain-containing protein n=1 Tax=Mycobacterium sp. OAS707 TaxID=2663822 RepID=UPI001788F2FC|nr:DUF4333 domain-containing protein [Mycobacterium sp. OAS707]MBE1551720.1 hypothetical protein [Mycobacterium sp. OAS707]